MRPVVWPSACCVRGPPGPSLGLRDHTAAPGGFIEKLPVFSSGLGLLELASSGHCVTAPP